MSDERLVLEKFLPYRLSVLSNRLSAAIAEVLFAALRPVDPGMARHRRPRARSRALGGGSGGPHGDGQGRGQPRRQQAADDGPGPAGNGAGRPPPHVLELTADGKRIYRSIAPALRRYETELLANLDPREQRQLGELLQRLEPRGRLKPPRIE
jgi:hypothetical protein